MHKARFPPIVYKGKGIVDGQVGRLMDDGKMLARISSKLFGWQGLSIEWKGMFV